MNVSIGILAYQEETRIGALLESLTGQTLLADAEFTTTIHCVPNGCRDKTAGFARAGLEKLQRSAPRVAVAVHEIAEPGKANAWNRFVHEFSAADADMLLLLDADIQLGEPGCLLQVVRGLRDHPGAVVAVDTPVKDIALSSHPSARDKMSLAASHIQLSGIPKLTGHLYCARAGALRRIWLPPGLLVEDGFLKAMLLTEGFSQPENTAGIVRAAGATHTFQAVKTFAEWFKHERRIFNGTAVNIALFEVLQKKGSIDGHTGKFIRDENVRDPDWVNVVVRSRLRDGIPGAAGFIRAPLSQAMRLPIAKRVKAVPIAAVRSLLNAAVFLACRQDLRAGRLHW